MGFLSGMGKCILIFLNIIFILVAIAFMACGIIVRFFLGAILSNSSITKAIKDSLSNVVDVNAIPKNLDFGNLTEVAGLSLILLGVFLFIVAFLAVCGACCNFRPLLGLFVFLIAVLMLAEIVITGLVAAPSSPVHRLARKSLEKQLKTEYNKPDQKAFKAAMDLLMYSAQCCGIEGQQDFANMTLTVDGKHVTIPPSCCTKENLDKKNYDCSAKPTDSYHTGCYDKILSTISSWKAWLVPTIIGILLFQGVEIFFAILVIRDISKSAVGAV